MRHFGNRLSARALQLLGSGYAALPTPGIRRPVFILGCGRSGTTILGTALAQHSKITYLNEPRRLWAACYAQTDIWSARAPRRPGKLVLTEADVDAAKSRKLSRMFRFATLLTGRPVLVEKLPINNFRLPFIEEIFPDARYVHILRNGVEVAHSIEQLAGRKWFGAQNYKWHQLVEYSATRPDTAQLPELCTNNYERGLLEWRHSTQAAYDFLEHIAAERFCEISYDEFVDKPVETVNRVLAFMGLEQSEETTHFVRKNVKRKTSKLSLENLSDREVTLGGAILQSLRERDRLHDQITQSPLGKSTG